MRLIDDERVIGLQQRVGLRLGQQYAIGHQFDRCIAAQPILKSYLEAHDFAQRRLQFFCNALGNAAGGDATRLGVTDQLAAGRGFAIGQHFGVIAQPTPHGQRDFGQLRSFARAGFTADDDDLVALQQGHDFLALARYRQGFGEFDA